MANVQFVSDIPETLEKRHNTAPTSRESFIILTNEGRLIDQKKAVYEAIRENQPITSRRLSEITKTERTNITRSLYDLEHEIIPSIKVAFIAKCPITQRKVKHYTLIDWQPVKQLSMYE